MFYSASCWYKSFYRLAPGYEEASVVEPEAQEEQVFQSGFDICGTDPEPVYPETQGKPRMHLNPTLVL